VGGRLLDARGAKIPVVVGCGIAAVGFLLWASSLTTSNEGSQWYWMVLAGAGMGLMVGPANTDAINRAPRTSYGEATGITQTVRNYGSSLGLAVLGTVLISANASNIAQQLRERGVPPEVASGVSATFASGTRPSSGADAASSPTALAIQAGIQQGFAESSQRVFTVMGGAMAVACAIALVGLRGGRQDDLVDAPSDASPNDCAPAATPETLQPWFGEPPRRSGVMRTTRRSE
jgi:hypothetical protein